MAIGDQHRRRYLRNLLLEGVGEEGQETLLKSRVLVVGAGGLGSPAAMYCVAAGVGTLGIVDDDRVELSNLQRQVLHSTADLGRAKVESAGRKLRALNPDTHIERHGFRLTEQTARECVAQYDFVIDASDNFETKFLVNDVCIRLGRAFSHAGVVGYRGQTLTVIPRKSACYRCVFGAAPASGEADSSAQVGILGAVAGTIGAIQATECIKYLCGLGMLLTDRMLVYDSLSMKMRTVAVKRAPSCPVCGG